MSLNRGLNRAGAKAKGTIYERLGRMLTYSTATNDILLPLVRLGAAISCLTLVGLAIGCSSLLMHIWREMHSLGAPQSPASQQALAFISVVGGTEFVIFEVALIVILIRMVLITIHVGAFYRQEYLGTWSLLHHRVLGSELVVEDFWRPLYRRPTVFSGLKFPAYSKTLEDHLRFTASFLEALRDSAHGPQRVYYLHWLAGHGRMQRLRMRKAMWFVVLLYPLLAAVPLLMSGVPVLILALGYLGFLILAGCGILAGEGTLELQYRARLRALCEFFLDEGGPDPASLPPPPDIFGSPLRQWWVRVVEQVARLFNWRGGREE